MLLVDDDPLDREGICYLIEKNFQNISIKAAESAYMALELVQNEHFDVLMTDISMPNMNGFSLIEEIKQYNESIYPIVFSAYSDFNYVKKALRLGVKDYLLKPIDLQEFKETMSSVIQYCRRDVNNLWTSYILKTILKKETVEPKIEWNLGNCAILIDCYNEILDEKNSTIRNIADSIFGDPFVVFINESQMLLFVDESHIDNLNKSI